MTRGCNLQLPNLQVILLMAAPVTQEKGTLKALWSHDKNILQRGL